MPASVSATLKGLNNTGDPLITPAGMPLATVVLTFQLVDFDRKKPTSLFDAVTGELVSSALITVTTDAAGEFITSLWPNDRGDFQTCYKVTSADTSIASFYIIVDSAIGPTLLEAKSAYEIGTGSVSLATMPVAASVAANAATATGAAATAEAQADLASGFAADAQGYAGDASDSALAASASASAALVTESDCSDYAASAHGSATTATAQAVIATDQAVLSAGYKDLAIAAAGDAAEQVVIATQLKADTLGYQEAAGLSADAAALSETNSGTNATTANEQASAASLSAIAAAASELAAAGSASDASTSAGTAESAIEATVNARDAALVAQSNAEYAATQAGESAAVITDNLTAITTVSENVSDINLVAGDLGNITTVAGSIADISTAAANIVDIQNAEENAAICATAVDTIDTTVMELATNLIETQAIIAPIIAFSADDPSDFATSAQGLLADQHRALATTAHGGLVASTDSRLTDSRTPTAHDQAWSTITDTPTSLVGAGISDLTYSDTYFKDDMHVLNGINPVGSATLPTVDPAGEGWLFAGVSTDNVAVMVCQINHDAKQGAVALKPHIHWRKTTAAAGNVTWRCEAKSAVVGGDFGSYVSLGDISAPITETVDNNTATRHLITEFGALNLTVGLSTIVIFKLSRMASATGTDTYGADALAISFDFHYEIDSPGSATEYGK